MIMGLYRRFVCGFSVKKYSLKDLSKNSPDLYGFFYTNPILTQYTMVNW